MTSSISPICARALSKTYRIGFFHNKHVLALRSINLHVEPGRVYGLLGPNGAGKSTTIKILMNLVQPSSGEATLFGHAPGSFEARRMVGFVPENPTPYEYLTGKEFVTLSGQLSGGSGRDLEKRVAEVIAKVDMERAAGLQIRRYSKGMIQRIVLAQALVSRPKLLILDEPTSGLDPVGRRLVRDLVLEERSRGTAILFCTHIIPDVEAVCDSLAVLVCGEVMQEGAVQSLLTQQHPSMEFVVEGLDERQVAALGVTTQQLQVMSGRVLVRVADADAQSFLRRALEANARISSMQPIRASLEELFLKTLEKSRGMSKENLG